MVDECYGCNLLSPVDQTYQLCLPSLIVLMNPPHTGVCTKLSGVER